MTDFTRVLRLIDEIRQRVDQLEAEVNRLQTAANGTAPEAPPTPYDLQHVIPPTVNPNDPDSIVGGQPTADFPDCCAVGNANGYFCTGTLIAPNLVVTAKHCTNPTRVFLKGSTVNQPASGETIEVVEAIPHPDVKVDIQVLRLASNATVAPRHIAQGFEVEGKTALAVGFGTIDLGGTVGYGVKRKVEVPVMSLGCNDATDAGKYGCRMGIEMVAGHRGLNRDSCRGDSGGPLYITGEQGMYLLGVTSRGTNNATHVCGDGGVYVRIDQFVDWIRQRTGVQIEGPLL